MRLLRNGRSPGSVYAGVPARVLAAVREQQDSSEILIGWVQLGIVCTFGVLWAISPRPYSTDPKVSIEPWVLGAYTSFTLLRLHLAYRRRLPEWLLEASTVLDMMLLLGLIWSFHLKYEQPAAFYLKVPTLLYVFIFVALRTLRFEVRYVVVAGLVAAGGWLLMVWYAIAADPAGAAITRDYVHYMTANAVLLGAEFDKVISIVLVTAILAAAISRARGLLVRSVLEHAAAEQLSRFVPSEVARRVATSEQRPEAGQGEVREGTILFADIEGFTTISESASPPELVDMLNDYFSVVTEPIVRRGGVINQFQGDAILATFNLPQNVEDHAARAVEAALEIMQLLRERRFGPGIELRSRIGISTGVVIGGLVGTRDRLGYTVHGDDVNLAARLERLNKDYGTRIIVSERTRELAGPRRFSFRRLGVVEVRGRRAQAVVFAVESEPGPPRDAPEPGPD